MSYSWKELNLELYSVTTTHSLGGFFKMGFPATTEIHIILPNGSRLKFKPYEYNLDEFPSLEKLVKKLNEKTITDRKNGYRLASYLSKVEQSILTLVVMAFKHYFDAVKGENETSSEIAQIILFLKRNSGKAFTVQALFNRINDLGLDEKAKSNIDLNTLEQILDDLSVNGKIRRQDKEGKSFFFF